MENDTDEHADREHAGHSARGFVAGMLLGSLAGAAAMLLLAPESGRRTQVRIRRTSRDLRDQLRAEAADVAAKVGAQAEQLEREADKMGQRVEHVLDVQKERWAPVVEAGKTAVKGA